MNRVPSSERIRQAIRELLESGVRGDEDVLNELIRLGSLRLVQEILEQEVEDLEGELEDARERAEALAKANLLANPKESLVWVLAEACEREKLNVKRLLGLKGSREWHDFDPSQVDPQARRPAV
jgi:hypothetical protein